MNDKERLELERLKVEIENARRPFLRQPASWAALATALATISGISLQWYSTVKQRDNAKDAGTELSEKLNDANQIIITAQSNALQYERKVGELQGQLALLKQQLDQWQSRTPTANEVKEAKSNLVHATALTTQFRTNLTAKSEALRPIRIDPSKLKAFQKTAPKK